MEELSRKQKNKHDHRFTTWLKNIIFGIVMIAPFLSVMARTIYVQSNPNAMQSYYGETINQVIINNASNELVPNIEYKTTFNDYNSVKTGTSYYANYIGITQLLETNINSLSAYIDVIYGWDFYESTNDHNIRFYYYNQQNTTSYLYVTYASTSNVTNYYLKYKVNNNVTINDLYKNKTTFITYNNYSFLDNAFDYSINELHNINVYNWSKNTAIYTAIDNMTTGLGMGENNTLALLLAYWSILTAVYIVFDIIIFCFTKITHFINND